MKRTVSKVRLGGSHSTLLQKCCNTVAENGGAFSIEDKWIGDQWESIYIIDWPDLIETPAEVAK